MFRKLMLFLAALSMVSALAYAEDKYSISGEVTFQHDGNIYICLLTKEGFRDFNRPGHELSKSTCKVVDMNANLKKAGKVSFAFDNIEKGTYCIITYQDVSMNGEVDFAGLDKNEPWGIYKEGPIGITYPSWETAKFDLEKDFAGIKIEM